MKAQPIRKRRRAQNSLGRLDLRIELSQEEILADLRYPARPRQVRRA